MRPPFATIAFLLLIPPLALTCGSEIRRQDPERDVTDPRVRLRLSGQLEGKLEPCGCASAQLGGLARRAFLLAQDRSYDLLIEGGNLTREGNALDEMKLITMLSVLSNPKAPYRALGLGPLDLAMPTELVGQFFGGFGIPAIASDLVAKNPKVESGELTWAFEPFTEHTAEGTTTRIASFVLAKPTVPGAAEFQFELLEPAAAWQRAMAGAGTDTLRILLVQGPNSRVREFAKLEPRPDLLVAVNTASPEPPTQPEVIDGVPMVHPGTRGRFLLDVTLRRNGATPSITRYRAIPLKGSDTVKGAMEDKGVKQLILDHRQQVKEAGILAALADQTPTPNGHTYIGSEACAECHEEAYDKWGETKHATAWDTLESAEVDPKRYGWPVTHYPDCVKCHVVGYGQKSGFRNPDDTFELAGVGCEECHGPGGAHAKDPEKFPLGKMPERKCFECHDYEQTPDFDWDRMWKQIEHK